MKNITFYSPTKIYFKEDLSNIGNIISSYNFNNILIIYGGFAAKSGILDIVKDSLKLKNINYSILSGVRENPEIRKVNEGIKISKDNKVDCILAIGGGSVIDTAKCIAVNYYYDGDSFDFNMHKVVPSKALPIGVILTIPASGSEMSNSCVIQNDELGIKQGFNNDLVRPLFAVENPSIAKSLSKKQLACGIVDIMMHTFERYFCESNELEFSDYMAIGLLKSVKDAGTAVFLNKNIDEAYDTLMIASSISHNGLTSIGKPSKMPVHFLEHIVSGRYPYVIHGEGLAILFPNWLEYNLDYLKSKMARLNKELFTQDFKNELEGAKLFISNIKDYFKFLNMPSKLSQINKDISLDELMKQFDFNDIRAVNHKSKMFERKTVEEIFKLSI